MIRPLTQQELDLYCERIEYSGARNADLDTLTALHRAHLLSIPFENLDVQLGTPPGLDPDAIHAKLVAERRGGWCFEHNCLFSRALAALGFDVVRLGGGVMREVRGDSAMGDHLCLKVILDGEPWLVDVGFGSIQIEPLPLAEQTWEAAPMTGRLLRTDDGHWRFTIDTGPTPMSYDFLDHPADEAQLSGQCEWLGRDGNSPFVQNLIIQQRTPEGLLMLRGKVFSETGPDGTTTRELSSADELVAVLRDVFALDMPAAARLWPAIEERHAALFA